MSNTPWSPSKKSGFVTNIGIIGRSRYGRLTGLDEKEFRELRSRLKGFSREASARHSRIAMGTRFLMKAMTSFTMRSTRQQHAVENVSSIGMEFSQDEK